MDPRLLRRHGQRLSSCGRRLHPRQQRGRRIPWGPSLGSGWRKTEHHASNQPSSRRSQTMCTYGQHDSDAHGLQLSRGEPQRSGIEIELRNSLIRRSHPTAVAWIRSHIGISGNTHADRIAEFHSHLGEILHSRTATHEGLRAASRAHRKTTYTQTGFGIRRSDWHRHSLSTYTWYRTEKGPQRAWLHRIGKADGPSCPCGHPEQTGEHITFHCPRHENERNRLLRGKNVRNTLYRSHPRCWDMM